MTLNEFKSNTLKRSEHRNHKVKNSLGIYDIYKYIRKNKWFGLGIISEYDFYRIIRTINKYLAQEVINGRDLMLPLGMGRLELRKKNTRIYIENNKVKSTMPIDWDRTLELWYQDEEAYKKRSLVKMEEKTIFKIVYNKSRATYTNKYYYQFSVTRDIKVKLKQQIKEGNIDAFALYE